MNMIINFQTNLYLYIAKVLTNLQKILKILMKNRYILLKNVSA